jgi:hypothetical protein
MQIRLTAATSLTALALLLSIGCADAFMGLRSCSCDSESTPQPECGPPVVDTGDDQSATVGQVVILRGGVRLPPEQEDVCLDEKNSLVFQWEQVDGPAVSLEDSDQREAFFIPMQSGEYLFRFRAEYPPTELNKKSKKSEWDDTKIMVRDAICGPPTAETGDDQFLAIDPGNPVTVRLDGNRSHAVHQSACEDITIARYSWTVAGRPSGSNVAITDADQETATVDLSVAGEYRFKLEVQDTGGTAGRVDTDNAVTRVTLLQRPVCEDSLDVTAVNALDGSPIEGAHVAVVDADGTSHAIDTHADGVASFSGLSPGKRQSIAVGSDDMVPALPGIGAGSRVRFEITTVLDHCADKITVPLRLTESGRARAAMNNGRVFAKVPASVFNLLPHSWKCAGECMDDNDCQETYYCEHEDHRCKNLCTPRSLLPSFSLGDTNFSGQFRFVMLVPVLPHEGAGQFDPSEIFAPPSGERAAWPGNLATDDSFLNGMCRTLGLEPWGDICVRTSDCPNTDDYVCETDPSGEHRCRDKSPLRNVEMALPAGQGSRLALVAGVMDLSFLEFILKLFENICIFSCEKIEFDREFAAALLSAMRPQTLHVCLLEVDVASGEETDISAALEELTAADCWKVDCQQKDSVVALASNDSLSLDPCTTDDDCGWPDSGMKCLSDPYQGARRGCFTPLFRVRLFTDDRVVVRASAAGFDPASDRADDRLCAQLPESAPYEELCDEYDHGVYESCEPPRIHDLEVPAGAECSYPYSLSVLTLEFPVGHASLPEGGRIPIGFDFNRTPDHYHEPAFLYPSLESLGLSGASLVAHQVFLRNRRSTVDKRNFPVPGKLGVSSASMSDVGSLDLPGFIRQPAVDALPDAGLDLKVVFVTEDPTVWPDPAVERVYAVTDGLGDPLVGVNDLPGVLNLSSSAGGELIGVVVSRVDRAEVWIDEEETEKKEVVLVDPLWRIYAPGGTMSIPLPPLSDMDTVWVAPWTSSVDGPFDYDLFLTHQVLGRQSAYTRDGYALIVP